MADYTVSTTVEPFQIALDGELETTTGQAIELWQAPSLKLFLHYRGGQHCLTEATTGRLLVKAESEIGLWLAVKRLLAKHSASHIEARIATYARIH